VSFEHDDALRGYIRRARLLETDDSGSQLRLRARGLASEEASEVWLAGRYGFHSRPPAGSEGIFAALGGRADRLIGLGFEHPERRPRGLPDGGSAMHGPNDANVTIGEGGKVTIDAKGAEVEIKNASKVTARSTGEILLDLNGQRFHRFRPGRVDLAVKSATEQATPKVMTEAGPCATVFARVD
jgi:phage gp45-like